MPHEFEQLEDAALAALAPLKTEGLRTLATYAGEMEIGDVEAITAWFPCIYAVAGGLTRQHVNRTSDARLELVLLVGDRNVRSHTAPARGDAASPGVYHLLRRVRDLIDGQPLVAGFSPFRGTGELPLAYKPKDHLCVYIATYRAQGAR